MSKIQDLPTLDRPREKAFHYGIDTLSNLELLALIIGSGYKDNSAIDVAYGLFKDNCGLVDIANKSEKDLLKYKGIGKAIAIKIIATFEMAKRYQKAKMEVTPQVIDQTFLFNKYSPLISNSQQEHVFLVVLNKKKQMCYEVNLYKGSHSKVVFSIRDILKEVISHDGVYFYIIHNHPSQNPNPSEEDIAFTSELLIDAKKIGLYLLDHLIITKDSYYSFLGNK